MVDGQIDDCELRRPMTQYQNADPAALEELVRRISPPLLRYFNSSRFGRADAEDMVQDCWMKIHRSRHTYRSSEPGHAMDLCHRPAHTSGRLPEGAPACREGGVGRERTRKAASGDARGTGKRLRGIGRWSAGRSARDFVHAEGFGNESGGNCANYGVTVGAVKQKASRAYATLRRTWGKDPSNARRES